MFKPRFGYLAEFTLECEVSRRLALMTTPDMGAYFEMSKPLRSIRPMTVAFPFPRGFALA